MRYLLVAIIFIFSSQSHAQSEDLSLSDLGYDDDKLYEILSASCGAVYARYFDNVEETLRINSRVSRHKRSSFVSWIEGHSYARNSTEPSLGYIKAHLCANERWLELFSTRIQPSGSTPTQPQVATAKPMPSQSTTTPATLTPQDQRLTQYISAIKARTPSLLAGLSSTQDHLQRKWIVNRALSAMEQMSPGAAATKYSTGFTELKKLWNQSRDACKNVTDGELEACTNGAYFGSPEDRAAIERAPNTPQSYKPDPKLKLVPVDNVNRCLTVDMKSLFGGFTNSCNFSVMYVYCLENPDKGAWSEAFRCAEGARGIRALGTVGPNKTDTAHTHRGRVIFFACAWQTKPGAGPYGIWGQTTYNEGVGTPGIIRGTCGEQIYAP